MSKQALTQKQRLDAVRFDRLQAARRAVQKACDELREAHLKIQENGKTAHEMADGDIRSLGRLPLINGVAR